MLSNALSIADLAQLRADPPAALIDYLRTQRYALAPVAELVGAADPDELYAAPALLSLLAAEELATRHDPLTVLTRLFWMGQAIERAAFDVLSPALADLLLRRRLVTTVDGSAVRAAVAIREWNGALLLSDPLFEHHQGQVIVAQIDGPAMPVHETTLLLWRHLRFDARQRHLLDVGAGCGALSLCADARYSTVVGIDLAPRCVAFSALNAALNGCRGVYSEADCFSFAPPHLFDHVVFCTPWAVDARPEAALPNEHWGRFVTERLGGLLSAHGTGQLFVALARSAQDADVAAALRRTLGTSRWSVVAQPTGGSFYISSAEIAARRVRRHCGHLRYPGEAPALARYLINRDIVEVVPLVLTLRHATVPSVEVRADETLST